MGASCEVNPGRTLAVLAMSGLGRPDYRPQRRYTVALRSIDGHVRTVQVVTNRGEAKAAYLAGIATSGLIRRTSALDVEIRDDGPLEFDPEGNPILRGYALDRDEW
jgi:hypothetical protein